MPAAAAARDHDARDHDARDAHGARDHDDGDGAPARTPRQARAALPRSWASREGFVAAPVRVPGRASLAALAALAAVAAQHVGVVLVDTATAESEGRIPGAESNTPEEAYIVRIPALADFAATAVEVEDEASRLDVAWKLSRALKRAGNVFSVTFLPNETQIGILVEPDRVNQPKAPAPDVKSDHSTSLREDARSEAQSQGRPVAPPLRTGWGGSSRTRTANRFTVFREWLEATYGLEALRTGGGVLDVAGGKGDLAFKLVIHAGVPTTIVDPRPMDVPNMLRHVTRALLHRLAQRQNARGSRVRLVAIPFPRHIRTWFWYPLRKSMGSAVPEAYVNDPLQPVPVERSGLEDALQACSVIVGMHADQATEAIVDWGLGLGKPFATVPCCVFPNLFPERSHVRKHPEFLRYLVAKDEARVLKAKLDFAGRNDVVYGNVACASSVHDRARDAVKTLASEQDGQGHDSSPRPSGDGSGRALTQDQRDLPSGGTGQTTAHGASNEAADPIPAENVSTRQTEETAAIDTVILPWSPLAVHLQETGEDEGAVYESLEQELAMQSHLWSENPVPEMENEDSSLPAKLASDKELSKASQFPVWMREARPCPSAKMARQPWKRSERANLAFILLRWVLAAILIGLVLDQQWRGAFVACALLGLILGMAQLEAMAASWTASPEEKAARACQALECEMVSLLWAIKRRELQSRGFALRSIAPPITRIERNECLRAPAARHNLQAPALRKRLLRSAKVAAQSLDGASSLSMAPAVMDVPLLAEIEKEMRALYRARARFASCGSRSQSECRQAARALSQETRDLLQASDNDDQGQAAAEHRKGRACNAANESLRRARLEMAALRQGLAGVESVLWACEEEVSPGAGDLLGVPGLVSELAAKWQSLQSEGGAAVERLSRLSKVLKGGHVRETDEGRGRLDGSPWVDGDDASSDGDVDGAAATDEVSLDRDNSAKAVPEQCYTDVYQGFVDEPEPRRRPDASRDLVEDDSSRTAALASNMLGELGNVLSHHRAGLAPERVVRTDGQVPRKKEASPVMAKDPFEAAATPMAGTAAHAVVGELAQLLAGLPAASQRGDALFSS